MSRYEGFDALVLERLKDGPVAWLTNDGAFYWANQGTVERKDSDIPLYLAPQAPALPPGWVAVPPELTAEMRQAWDSAPFSEDDDIEMRSSYLAMLSAAPKPPALPDDVAKDAARYRWLTDDHKGSVRERRNTILDRMPVMSHSATCAAIDAAMANDPGSQEVQE